MKELEMMGCKMEREAISRRRAMNSTASTWVISSMGI